MGLVQLPTADAPSFDTRVPSPTPRRLGRLVRWFVGRPVYQFCLVALLAFGVRAFGLTRSFELWVDEILYARLGESVSLGQVPNLPDGPFFLHPPGFFIIEGLTIRLFDITGDDMHFVHEMRWLNASIGAISVGLVFLVAARVANPTMAAFAAIVLAFEPFVLRNNSRVFLETPAVTVILAGFLLLVTVWDRYDRLEQIGPLDARTRRRQTALLVAAGLLLGYGILTKDMFGVYTVVPLWAGMLWKRTVRRREVVVVTAAMATPYVVYLLFLVITGYIGDWYRAKASGVMRMLGTVQDTGFNAPGAPSLVSRLIDQVGQFGTSYLLLAMCPVAGVLASFSTRRDRRFLGLTTLFMGLFAMYSALFGTFEENFGYGVMIAGVLGVSIVAAELHERRPSWRRRLAMVGVTLTVLSVALGVRAETTVDNGFEQVYAWVYANLPQGAKVSVTNGTAELIFAGDERFGVWATAPKMESVGARYILTQSLPTSQGYGYLDPAMLTWLQSTAHPLISIAGPTNGETTVWYVDADALRQAADAGLGASFTPISR